ncbi:MAG TPA: hypothetical protein VII76_03310 [Acidimicrobiales bacterium]
MAVVLPARSPLGVVPFLRRYPAHEERRPAAAPCTCGARDPGPGSVPGADGPVR